MILSWTYSSSLFAVIILTVLQKNSIYGFTCYSCTYDIQRKEDWNRPECRNDTEALGKIGRSECEDTKYCVIQEMYDLVKETITNYDRRCSATSLGNKCTKDTYRVICVSSCQGDFCNGAEIIEELKEYIVKSSTQATKTWSLHNVLFLYCVYFVVNKVL